MGFAARRWHTGLSVLAFFVGLLPAMFLHNRWNSMGQDFLVEYVVVQVPIFLLAVGCIVLLRVAEKRLTRQRLHGVFRRGLVHPGRGGAAGHPRRPAHGPALGGRLPGAGRR